MEWALCVGAMEMFIFSTSYMRFASSVGDEMAREASRMRRPVGTFPRQDRHLRPHGIRSRPRELSRVD